VVSRRRSVTGRLGTPRSSTSGVFKDLRTSVAIAHGRHECQGADKGGVWGGGSALSPRKFFCNSSFPNGAFSCNLA